MKKARLLLGTPNRDKYRAINQAIKELCDRYISNEGSLSGLCWDICCELKRRFPFMEWHEGWVESVDGSFLGSHSWMEWQGKIFDPTRIQFPSGKLVYFTRRVH